MKLPKLEVSIKMPEGVTGSVDKYKVTVKGKEGEISRDFKHLRIDVTQENDSIIFTAINATKREKTMIFTFKAHMKNMIAGVQKKHLYSLKVCSGHFPMNVSVKGNELNVKNFLGEKVPRVLQFSDDVNVKLNGQEITVQCADIELAGNVATQIEQLMRTTSRDRRIFQDGIWITSKPHKVVM
jgi:large subunit ribosomal protein L6